jgi:ribonucleoside-diphosphate reductase alpha chain
MVCLDMDHPDIDSFVNWKVREEIKVAALVEGMKAIAGEKASPLDTETVGETAQRLGLTLDYDFNGEAYLTVSGQNSNNSVRIPDAFFDAIDAGTPWETRFRTTGEVARTFDARELWNDIAYAAWRCADPGVQFDTTINAWHTCPGGGRINASEPVQRVHVPRQHGVQPGVAQHHEVLRLEDAGSSTSRSTSTPSTCGRWCSRSAC